VIAGFRSSMKRGIVAAPLVGLPLGLALWLAGSKTAANSTWMIAALPVLARLAFDIVVSLSRKEFGLDIAAALSMSAALSVGENLAAAIVALMYAGGQYLEAFAEGRAQRDMTALLARRPIRAMRFDGDGLREAPADDIVPGDRLLIRQGDVTPVDGFVKRGIARLDLSALTGESLPVRREAGAEIASGASNIGEAFELVASRAAKDSVYAGIVRMVEAAQRSKAPMSRLADHYALGFLAITVVLAGLAWSASGDAVRAVAVLVIATPCPLLLAVPVALVAGMSRAARHGILVKGAQVVEGLAGIRAIVLDKTGTLTEGRLRLAGIELAEPPVCDESTLLRLAASLDQASPHVAARALVDEARERGLSLAVPDAVSETAGEGISGRVEGLHVVLGGPNFVAGRISRPDATSRVHVQDGVPIVAVAVDGRFAGRMLLSERLRDGAEEVIGELRSLGVERVVLATGDLPEIAAAMVAGLPLDAVHAGQSAADKVAIVRGEQRRGPVMMVGDGVNDAPALAAATVGAALGAHGSAASAETADLVLLVDSLDRLPLALRVARRARDVARQSVFFGIGLSFLGMAAAAMGWLTPVQGALLQEAIDVAVVLNALRALSD
jgi:heavy metal translocating P-type ATPase